MIQKPNYYAILSAEVRYDNRLKANTKLMYAEITALCNMNGKCYATNKYFSKLYNVGKGSISGYINELVKYGYIETEYTYKEGSKEIENRYIKILKGGVLEKHNGVYQETEQNNTTNTNNNITYNNKKSFKKPTLVEIDLYCADRKNNVDHLAFYDFYESKNWYIGKNKMKDWKAAIRTWERREEKKPKTMSKLDAQISAWQEAKKLL
jgi:hypothetical protein